MAVAEEERLKRWRLVLGSESEAGGDSGEGLACSLSGEEAGMDKVLQALYSPDRKGGLGSSSPNVNRWLGDIRKYFPSPVVRVMQRDAMDRLNLQQMLFEPETLAAVEADVHLVATLVSLKNVIPKKTKETAREVVRKVVEDLKKRLMNPTVEAVRGSLSRATRTSRPRVREIDWDRTIRKNLKNYQPDRRILVVDRLVGFGHRRSSLRDVVLCIDQSGSMASSVVYSSVFGAVLASMPALTTRLIVFDTEVVDLTEQLHDPVDLLFGAQLGGGTDINRALGYCQQIISRPSQTILVLITDLCEGGDEKKMLQRAAQLHSAGVQVVCLLALSDEGAPYYSPNTAAAMAAIGIPTFACTPDQFPALMAAAIQRRDLNAWAAREGIVTARGAGNR